MIFQSILQRSFAQNANRIAIESQNTSTTYADLSKKANAVTNFLMNNGVAKESHVCVLTDDRELLIAAMIGIINAGCVFVPISAKWPQKKLESIIDQIKPAWIVSTYGSNRAEANYVSLKQITENVSLQDTPLRYPEYEEDDSIYIYFTSGTTGIPKGIIGRNKSLLQFLQWQIALFGLDDTVRVSQLISPYFDAFLRDVFIPLLTGGVVCLPIEHDDLFTPNKIINWLETAEVNLIHCVPSIFRIIKESILSSTSFPHLKWIMLSGEKINPAELKSWYDVLGERINLVNFYGATETTMIRSSYIIKPTDALRSSIPIGQPIYDTSIFILNPNGVSCPKYVPGEIFIASPYLSKGYFNDPYLTRQKFVNLFEGTPNECLAFKTGDTGRFMEDGQIELLGRTDRQVKIKGVRTDLNEIENIFLGSGLLKNCVIIYLEESDSETKPENGLYAYVISKGDVFGEELVNSLLIYSKDYVADYSIPVIIEVNDFPMLQNGKIDHRALMTGNKPKNITHPSTQTESRLLSIWKEILGDNEISVTNTFQEMGGSSLSMMRLIAWIYKEFNVRVSLKDLFGNLTIQKQATLIDRSIKDDLLRVIPAPVDGFYATSSAQKRIYFEQKSDSLSTAYNLPMAWQLADEVDLDRLKHAIQSLFNRHESLRTRFEFRDDDIYQYIDPAALTIQELRTDKEPVIKHLIKPFDLASDTLFRCNLIYVDNAAVILFIDIHHIICDGISQVLLFSDLLELYNEITPDTLQIQYKDYATWEQKFKQSEDYQQYGKFWHNALTGILPKIKWPVKAIGDTGKQGSNYFFKIDEKLVMSLTQLWQQSNATLFTGFLASYYLFLCELLGQDDIIIGINSSGRLQNETEKIVGMFAKTLPIRFTIGLNTDCRTYFENVQLLLNSALSSQIYDYLDIIGKINHNAPHKYIDVFETTFSFQNFSNATGDNTDSLFRVYDFDINMVKYPFSMFMHQTNNGSVMFRMEYQNRYFKDGDVEILANRFVHTLTSIADNFESTVGKVCALGKLSNTLQPTDHFRF